MASSFEKQSDCAGPDFQAIFESMPGLYAVLAPDEAFTIVAVSDAYLRERMRRREELLGRGLLEAFPEEAGGTRKLKGSLERVRSERVAETMTLQKYDVPGPDGILEEKYWSTVNSPVLGEGGELRYIIHRVEDVTEFVQRRRAEERLRDESKFIEAVQDVSRSIAAELDLHSIVQRVTDATTKLCGAAFGAFFYNVVDEAGQSYSLYTISGVPREAFSKFPQPRNTLIFGPTFRGEEVVRLADVTKDERFGKNAPYYGMPKGHLPVRSYLAVPVISRNGHVIGGLFYGHPEPGRFDERGERLVTAIAAQAAVAFDNAQLFQTVKLERDRIGLILRGASIGLWYCPLPLDKLTWDERVKEHFWLEPEAEVTIELFYERIHPEDRERTREAVEESVETRGVYDVEYRTVNPQDREQVKWIRAIGQTYYTEEGKPTRFDGVTIDITDQKRAVEERERLLESERRARQEAEHANRMKDEFLSTVSHELRTPLNAIVGWSQLIKRGQSDAELVWEGIDVIERNARIQSQIIEDLLDMNRIIAGKIRLDVQRVDLPGVIEAAYESVRPAAEAKQIRVQKVIDPLAGPVNGDPARLQQVVWNLLTNAIKFTPAGGRVQVLLERVNSHLEITVADNGQGIKPEFLPHVFDRFRQFDQSTSRRHGGLGLGLAIVKNLVELHGGQVRAKSPGEGQGATFSVALPLPVMRTEQDHTRQHPRTPRETGEDPCFSISLKGVKVLVVDDEADARELVRRVLTQCHAEVMTAGSAAEGLALVAREKPDVILSDIGMPEQDGYEFLRTLRRRNVQTPAAALTAFARSEDRRQAMLAGYQTHIAKPAEPAELIATVASLAGRTSGNEE